MYSNRDFDQENRDESLRSQEELSRLRGIEERLELAIQAHNLFIENIESDPYKAAIITKEVALHFTLDILTDIRG